MKTPPSFPRPSLWRRKPTFGLARRLKATGIAVVLAMFLVPLITWAQTAPITPAASAPAVAPAASAPDPVGETKKIVSGLPAFVTSDATTEDVPGHKMFPDPTGGFAGSGVDPSSVTTDTEGVNSGVSGKDGVAFSGDNPAAMSVKDLYSKVAHNTYSINMVWTMICGFLVMFMQLGFAMVETGLTRAKNAGHTFAMNMMIYPLGCLAFYAYGFAIGWGNWWNGPVGPGWYSTLGPGTAILNSGFQIGGWTLFGTKGFFLAGCQDVSVLGLFFFMMVFMDTTATIPTGTMCERWRWNNFAMYGLFVALPYCIFGCWAWGGGWLAQLGVKAGMGHGYVDFAGSGVVHLMGGIIGLIGAIVIGPRIGKFVNGKPVAIPGHDLPMVMGGTFVLAFGWFGFNPGSTLAGTDLRLTFAIVNTMLAGIVAALASMVVMQLKFGKPDPSMMCNGMLAGLVAITAPCAFVSPVSACIIGLIAGVIVVYSVFFWDNMGIDDPVGAISVHGLGGLFGVLSVGLFASGDYGGGWNGVVSADAYANNVVGILPFASVNNAPFFSHAGMGQLGAQAIGGIACIVTGGLLSFVWFKLSNLIIPIRVDRETELQGADIPEMGALAYPDFELKTTQSVSDITPNPVHVKV